MVVAGIFGIVIICTGKADRLITSKSFKKEAG